jgi:hypothetical protein
MAPIASGADFDVYRETVYRGVESGMVVCDVRSGVFNRGFTLSRPVFLWREKIKTEAVKPPVL